MNKNSSNGVGSRKSNNKNVKKLFLGVSFAEIKVPNQLSSFI